jgi:hypothetical protein
MNETFIQLTEDEFDDQFPLVVNHLNPNASWGFADAGGCLFETYDTELEFVQKQDASNIWTLIDGDDGDLYVVSGYHHVNRIGYLISLAPVPPDTFIEVRIPASAEEHDATSVECL